MCPIQFISHLYPSSFFLVESEVGLNDNDGPTLDPIFFLRIEIMLRAAESTSASDFRHKYSDQVTVQ